MEEDFGTALYDGTDTSYGLNDTTSLYGSGPSYGTGYDAHGSNPTIQNASYTRGDAQRDGAVVGGSLGFAAGVASGVPNAGGVGSITGGYLGNVAGGAVYDSVTNGNGEAVVNGVYTPLGDYTGFSTSPGY